MMTDPPLFTDVYNCTKRSLPAVERLADKNSVMTYITNPTASHVEIQILSHEIRMLVRVVLKDNIEPDAEYDHASFPAYQLLSAIKQRPLQSIGVRTINQHRTICVRPKGQVPRNLTTYKWIKDDPRVCQPGWFDMMHVGTLTGDETALSHAFVECKSDIVTFTYNKQRMVATGSNMDGTVPVDLWAHAVVPHPRFPRDSARFTVSVLRNDLVDALAAIAMINTTVSITVLTGANPLRISSALGDGDGYVEIYIAPFSIIAHRLLSVLDQ